MKPEDQNSAIAEALGRHYHRPTEEEKKSGSYYQYERDFLHDLNAIQEAVLNLSEEIQHEWIWELNAILNRDFPAVDCDSWGYQFLRINATAAQRAEAFLRAICKWTD